MIFLSGYKTHALVVLYLLTLGYQIVTGQTPLDVNVMQEAVLAGMVSSARAALSKLSVPTA